MVRPCLSTGSELTVEAEIYGLMDKNEEEEGFIAPSVSSPCFRALLLHNTEDVPVRLRSCLHHL